LTNQKDYEHVTLKCVYVKDSNGEAGDNCGWVDPRFRGDKLAPAEAEMQWTGPSPAQDPSNCRIRGTSYPIHI
jgi:hypothetical protein